MKYRKWKALVIEDEAPLRRELVEALQESDNFEVLGEADSVDDGFALVCQTSADILFLDIQLIGGTAFHLLSRLRREEMALPAVVVHTGYREFEYAQRFLNEYKSEVIYILKKPFWETWKTHQDQIIDQLYERAQIKQKYDKWNGLNMISLRDGRLSYVVRMQDIIIARTGAKSLGRTVCVLSWQTIGCQLSLRQLLSKLPSNYFQVNRFEAVNADWITLIDHTNRELHLRNGEILSIGAPFYQSLLDWYKD